MNGSKTSEQHPSGVIDSVNAFGSNLGSLATLQLRLGVIDTRECVQRLMPSLVLGGIALLVLPSSVVVALLGTAYWIATSTSLTPPQALFAVAGGGLVVSALALLIAVRLSRGSFSTFRRSGEEFQRNLAWVRTVMKHSGR